MKTLVLFLFISVTTSIFTLELNHSFAAKIDSKKNSSVDYKLMIRSNYNFLDKFYFDLFQTYDCYLEESYFDASIYRLWARISNDNHVLKYGSQKINFGSARILRTLKWYDEINYFDPRKETNGIHAISYRYSSKNNYVFRLWNILNEKNLFQPGFNFQFPLLFNELGFSYRFKQNGEDYHEFGFDVFSDHIFGSWFEFTSKTDTFNRFSSPIFTIGSDYSYEIYYPMNFIVETQITDDELVGVFSCEIPIGISDNISLSLLRAFETNQNSVIGTYSLLFDEIGINLEVVIFPKDNHNDNIKLQLTYNI